MYLSCTFRYTDKDEDEATFYSSDPKLKCSTKTCAASKLPPILGLFIKTDIFFVFVCLIFGKKIFMFIKTGIFFCFLYVWYFLFLFVWYSAKNIYVLSYFFVFLCLIFGKKNIYVLSSPNESGQYKNGNNKFLHNLVWDLLDLADWLKYEIQIWKKNAKRNTNTILDLADWVKYEIQIWKKKAKRKTNTYRMSTKFRNNSKSKDQILFFF